MADRVREIALGVFTAATWGRAAWRGLKARRIRRWPPPPAPVAWPRVSVIVPAWKERTTIGACLRLLLAQDYPDFEVLIAAGGNDGTYTKAEAIALADKRVRVIEQQPLGKNAALNQAIPCTDGEVVVFLDADSKPTPGYLRSLVSALRDGVQATTGNYFPVDGTPYSLQGEMTKLLEYEVRGRVILQGSGGIAIRRKTLDTIGPFPTGPISSDWDMDARLATHGLQRAFVPDAVIYSNRPATWDQWWNNELRWRRLHLISLFRLKDQLLREPVPAAKHLYPYVVSWSMALATVALPLAALTGRRTAWQGAKAVWSTLFSAVMIRELASSVEIYTYRPETRWLDLFAATPFLTVAGWLASLIASVTTRKATVHFKGPRQATTQPGWQTATEPAAHPELSP